MMTHKTKTPLMFYDPMCTSNSVGQLVPVGTPLHLGEYSYGDYYYEAGKVAHVCAGPWKDWVRMANSHEIREVPALEQLAIVAE